MKTRALSIICATSLSAFSAEQPSDWYVGAMVTHNGKTETEKPDASFGSAFKLGYQFSPTWAIEASTGFYGKLDMIASGEYDTTTTKKSRYGSDLSLLGDLPLSARYTFYGGLGIMLESNDLSPTAQIGIRYDLSSRSAISLGYKFISNHKSEYKIQSLGLGIQYNFENTNNQDQNYLSDDLEVPSKLETDSPIKHTVKNTSATDKCGNTIYRVKQDDWLYKIANQHDISFEELMLVNDGFQYLRDINIIHPKQAIIIPNLQCE